MRNLLFGAWIMTTFAGGVAVARSGTPDAVDTSDPCDQDAVGRRRAPAPRCERCGDGKKICCPDCSLWAGKACVCDCKKGSCGCE